MTTAPEPRRVANNQPVQPGSGEPGAIARAVTARAQWVQRALSPWVRRWLPTVAGAEGGRETRLGRHAPTTLTGTSTNRLLDRVQRVVDRTTVWRADVGSIEPATVDRFTSAIADRFSATGARYEPQPLAVRPAETTDLILAGTPVQPGLGAEASLPGFETGGGEPAPRPTMAQLREVLADRSPPAPSQIPPPRIQRAAAERPKPQPPARTLPARARLFSQVEELAPRGEISPEEQPPEVRPAQAERAPEPSQPAEPPAPPVMQRPRPAVVKEAEPAQPEAPGVVTAEKEPPRPRTRIGRMSGPEVQRLPEEETSSQAAPLPEAPPSAETEPPRPPLVSQEVTPGRPEAPPSARVEPPMEPGQPAGQPQPALSADAPSVVEGVQRKVEPGEPAAGLEEEVLARAASRARLPLTEPLRPASGLARARPPAQMAIPPRAQVQARLADERVQARFADERVAVPVSKPVPERAEPARAGPARPSAWGEELPLPPVSLPVSAALIQRRPAAPSVDLTVAARGVDVVQRAVETPPETGPTPEEEGPELDLNDLARQVYPLIKRMLAVERERRSAR